MRHAEPGPFEQGRQAGARIAPVMAQGPVHRTVQRGQRGDEQDEPTRGGQHAADRDQRSTVVLDVFEDIEADDGVEALSGQVAVLVRQVEALHRDVRMPRKPRPQPAQVLLPGVGEHQPF